jgi:tetratricopeptide (TPR) repeat protein
MTEKKRRSAFGELVRQHRRRLGLSQEALVNRVARNSVERFIPGIEMGVGSIAVNTIYNWEKQREPGSKAVTRPYHANVVAVAIALELLPGTPEYAEFLAAARQPDPFDQPGPLPVAEVRSLKDSFVPAGREPQLRQLRQIVARAAAGQPGIAFVSAVAGTGKTRLIEQISEEAVLAFKGLIVAWGECTVRTPIADSRYPIRQVLDVLTGGVRSAGSRQLVSAENQIRLLANAPRAIRALVETSAGLIDHLISAQALSERERELALDPDLRDALARIRQVPSSIRGDAPGLEEDVFRLLVACAATAPLILVLEDLHWADEGTCATIFHLLRRLHGSSARIAIIASFRLAELNAETRRHPFRRVLNEAIRIFPDAVVDLSKAIGGAEGRSYIDGVIDRQPNQVPIVFRQHLFDRTAGLPLIVTGVLDIFIRDGVLDQADDGALHLIGEPDWQRIPAEIVAIYTERIERMSEDAQQVLMWASVQGDLFIVEVLMTAMQMRPQDLVRLLDDQLVRRHRLVLAEGFTTIARQRMHRYRFEHALLREITLQRIGDFERAHLHRRTAAALYTLFGHDPHEASAAIAWHLEQAGDNRQAAAALIEAGEFAMGRAELDTARSYFQHVLALNIAQDDPELHGQSLARLADCERADGNLAEGKRIGEEALAFAIRTNSRRVRANSLASLAMIEFDLGQIRLAVDRLRQAVAIREELGEPIETFRLHALLSHTLYGQEEYEAAISSAQEAYDLGLRLGDARLTSEALIARTNCFVDLGMFTYAQGEYRRCLELCQQANHIRGMVLCWLDIALCDLELGEWDQAAAALDQAIGIEQQTRMPVISGYIDYYAGLIAEGRADLETAQARYRASRDTRLSRGQEGAVLDPLSGLLRIAVQAGDRERAGARLADLLERIERQGVEGVEHTARLYLALIRAHRLLDDETGANRWLREGIDFLQRRAAKLTDPALRVSYLENVPAHRALLNLNP